MIAKKHGKTTRLAHFSIDYIFKGLDEGYHIPYVDYRATVFKTLGTKCVKCGLEGEYFAIDKHKDGDFHLDLFGIDSNGDEVLMTVDHILPKSKGGPHHIDNFQPMCMPCNMKKADKLET